MNDKASIKITPKSAVTVDLGDTLHDILPLLQKGLTEATNPETLPKINLTIRIGILDEKEQNNGR